MLDHLLAKTKDRETLGQHTDRVLNALQELRSRYEHVLGENETFWFDCFIAALFHDFGKASLNFQNMLLEILREPILEKKYEPIRHEFLSGVLLTAHTALKSRSRADLIANPAQIFAVFTHHKDFTIDLFSKDKEKEWKIKTEDAFAFFDYARQKLKESYSNQISFLTDIEKAWFFIAQKSAITSSAFWRIYTLR